ncbi:MAG TPA: hypothetical protein VJ890_24025 [Vineibacter sp.]|nr:hypothetical protein [Vineibacter sp.]
MTKKAFDGIMAGLKDALAYTRGDKRRAGRVVRIKPAGRTNLRRKNGLDRRPRQP